MMGRGLNTPRHPSASANWIRFEGSPGRHLAWRRRPLSPLTGIPLACRLKVAGADGFVKIRTWSDLHPLDDQSMPGRDEAARPFDATPS